MNIPDPAPMTPKGRAIVEMGKAAEYQIVHRWGRAGYTLGGSVPLHYGGPQAQLSIEDADTWLSGSLDSVLGIPNYPSILPIDIKSKSDKAIEQMKVNALSYDPRHYAQIQAYIYLCNLIYDEMGWKEMGFGPAEGAVLFYVSRDNPRNTFEYYFPADWDRIGVALKRLQEWKAYFLSDTLPQRDKDWRWTDDPCRWCQYKKLVCKPDAKRSNESLSMSRGNDYYIRENGYNSNLEDIRRKVMNRWTKQ